MKDLTICIATWNAADLLYDCLHSIYTNVDHISYSIIVADNGSKDGTPELMGKDFPGVDYIRNPHNRGVAKARNQCLRKADSKYALVLDVDTLIHPDSLEGMLAFMDKHTSVGICGPKLLNPDGSIQLSCRTFQTPLTILFRGSFLGRMFPNSKILAKHLMSQWSHDALQSVDWLMGACHMIRTEAMEHIGLLDEKFMYLYEDVEYCWRARKFGWDVYYLPQYEITHIYQRKSAASLNIMTLKHFHSIMRFMKLRYLQC